MSVTERLAALVAHDTQNPGGDEVGICTALADMLRPLGADHVSVEKIPRDGQTGAYVYAQFGTPRLLINAHVDTVPAQPTWTREPHEALITKDRVVGLGSADTKGAIAAILCALERQTPSGVGVLFSGDEELGTTVARAFLESEHAKGLTHAIVCEPTTRRVGTHHRGICAYRARFSGRGGHSSNADALPKPVLDSARLAVALHAKAQQHKDDGPLGMKGLCLNIADVSGGVAFNVVPDRAVLTWSLRPYPGFDVAAWEAAQADMVAQHGAELEIMMSRGGFACGHADRFTDLLPDVPRTGLGFWTEAALFQEHGIDCVVLGPGDIAQAHAPDEFVAVSDLAWAEDLFVNVFEQTA